MARFAFATLLPAVLLMLGSVFGGVWVVLAVGVITVFTFALDRLAAPAQLSQPGAEFPSGDRLSLLLALLHLPLLGLAIWAVSGHGVLSGWERLGLWIGYGLFFGQVAHPNAHELIHRSARGLRGLGVMVYTTLLIGHHVSAHRLVHHIHVATDHDPSTARLGESFWHFLPRGWFGAFRAGHVAETQRIKRRGRGGPHPYGVYLGGALMAQLLVVQIWGLAGVLSYLGIVGYAQLQMLLSDYVQHYGLRRMSDANGRAVPVGPEHSWNTPHWYSSAMMLNAPRHSDHHLHPMRAYPGLRLEEAMPVLPSSLPVMAVLALWPGGWRRVMDPRVRRVLEAER